MTLRTRILVPILAALAAVPLRVEGADIVNGWSPQTTITEFYSLTSLSMFKLAGVADGCGHGTYWQLPLNETVVAKTKVALIASAFAMGKRVALRCENSYVTDLQIFE
jgi:hypothetical protein